MEELTYWQCVIRLAACLVPPLLFIIFMVYVGGFQAFLGGLGAGFFAWMLLDSR